MPVEVKMCEHYRVELIGADGYRIYCTKGHKASIKCHERRDDCPDYKPSEALTLEEVKEKYGLR